MSITALIDLKGNESTSWLSRLTHAAGPRASDLISSSERANGGATHTVKMSEELISTVVFLTYHKRDFSGRLHSPDGDGTTLFRFVRADGRPFFVSYTENYGYKNSRYRVGGPAVLLKMALDSVKKKSTSHALILSVNAERTHQDYQITSDGVPKAYAFKRGVMNTKKYYADSNAFGSDAVTNKDLSHLMDAWYPRVRGGSGGVSAGTAATLATQAGGLLSEVIN